MKRQLAWVRALSPERRQEIEDYIRNPAVYKIRKYIEHPGHELTAQTLVGALGGAMSDLEIAARHSKTILAQADAWVQEKRAAGWTRQDFNNAFACFLENPDGPEYSPVVLNPPFPPSSPSERFPAESPPAVQNLPIRTPGAQQLRDAFGFR